MEEQPNEDGHRTTSPVFWTASSTTMMAWSRSPWVVVMSGAFRSAWAWRRVSHLPDLTPIDFALFTRAMPAAGIARVKSAKSMGVRSGKWLTLRQAQALLNAPDITTTQGLRDHAIIAVLLAVRKAEVVR